MATHTNHRALGSAIFALVLCLVQAERGFGQPGWQRTYGADGDDRGCSVRQTSDGGYIVTGNTSSSGAGLADVYLLKTDSLGEALWTRAYGGANQDYGLSVQETSDGGYIIAGYTLSFAAGYCDFWLIKTNTSGDTLWTRTYGGQYWNRGYSVQQTTDGGYIVAGESRRSSMGQYDVMVVSTDSAGRTLWIRTYGRDTSDQGRSVQQTCDGGFVVGGWSHSSDEGDCDAYLIKTDAAGETLWTRVYGGANQDCCLSVQQTSDSGYIAAGYTSSLGAGGFDFDLIKTDAAGEVLWTRTYGGPDYDWGNSVQQTLDGGYIIAGYTRSFGAGHEDIYLVKTDVTGETLWTRTYGDTASDVACSIQQTSDGGYIVAGYTTSFGASGTDVFLIKTDASGYTAVDEGLPKVRLFRSSLVLQAEPSPSVGRTVVRYRLPIGTRNAVLKIRDISGRAVLTYTSLPTADGMQQSFTWDASRVPAGIYFVEIEAAGLRETRMLIVAR